MQNGLAPVKAGVWNAVRAVGKWWSELSLFAMGGVSEYGGAKAAGILAQKNVLQEALSVAKPTSGHPGQFMATLEDGTRVIFRKDFGDKAHAIGGPFQGAGRIDHYNIEVQSATGKIIENVHVVPNGKGGFTWWGKDGAIKQ